MKKNEKGISIEKSLIKVFNEIKGIKRVVGGNIFDQTVLETLNFNLKGFTFISNNEWKRYYEDYRELTLKGVYDFTELKEIDNRQNDFLIIDKPNGSQQTPDILIIANKKGLCLEIKSAKGDKITWNSGLPKDDFIYIFNCQSKGDTTFFLGKNVMSDEVRRALREQDNVFKELASEFNKKLKEEFNSDCTFYPRAMFNSNKKYFNNKEQKDKYEKQVVAFIKNYSK